MDISGNGWRSLDETECSMIWDVVNDGFNFRPSTAFSMWPGLDEPSPSVTFRRPDSWTEAELDDLYAVMGQNFARVARPDEWLYALDWQHECFLYNPAQLNQERAKFAFQTGLFPNGD